jgi:hypothetical protein
MKIKDLLIKTQKNSANNVQMLKKEERKLLQPFLQTSPFLFKNEIL